LQIWLTPEGRPERVELIGSAGSDDLDRAVRDTLLRMARMPQAPPSDLPQPVVLQVSSS
jgi:TonB family protein